MTLGAGLRYVRRYASLYDLDAGALDALDDPALVEGSALAVDLGALWETPVQGLDAALAIYDLGGAMEYDETSFFDLLGGGGSDLQTARIVRALDGRDGKPSFRAGAAYRPAVPAGVPPLTLAADYVSASTTGYAQSLPGHLRLGAEATVARRLAVRLGLSGGGPSAGLTLDLVAMKLDYAVFSQPTGRFDGQDGGIRHALLLRLGLD